LRALRGGCASARSLLARFLVAIIGPEHAAFFQVGDGGHGGLEGVMKDGPTSFGLSWGVINSTNCLSPLRMQRGGHGILHRSHGGSKLRRFPMESTPSYCTAAKDGRLLQRNELLPCVRPQGQVRGIDEVCPKPEKYLSSDRVCERTVANKSLVLATRSQIQC